MSKVQRIIGALIRPAVKLRARGRSPVELLERLEASRQLLESRVIRAHDTPGNREAINHIVGIERWGQSRLKLVPGGETDLDSYRGYRLPDDSDLASLQSAFVDTRAETIRLVRELSEAGVDPQCKVRHNDLGDLTLVEWLIYLDDHAKRESIRIRGSRH